MPDERGRGDQLLPMILDHLFDLPVTRAAVASGAARARHFFARRSAALDGFTDMGISHRVADANEHRLHLTIMTIAFTFKEASAIFQLSP